MEKTETHRHWRVGPITFGFHRYVHVYSRGRGSRVVFTPYIYWDHR